MRRSVHQAERVLLNEVVALLQTLQVGLDVNVQFHDICAFEYTNACAIFDLLDMRLVHGWVVDPQDTVAYSLLAHKSYNQVVDQLIDYHSMCAAPKEQTLPTLMKERSLSMDDAALKLNQIAANGPVIDAFLADSATQLTYVGLIRLHEHMKERELAVFFRNNHFATIFKMEGALYLLVTDTGYFDEPHVIWEKLEQIDGDSEYYTMTFAPVVGDTTKQKELLQPPSSGTVHDEAPLVAPVPAPRPAVPSRDSPSIAAAATLADDYALALKLQQEEDEADALFVRHAKRPSPQGTTKNSPTGMAAPPLRPSSPARQSEAVTSIVRPQQPPPLRPGGSNDPSLLILTAEELQMQADAERHYNQQRRMQLGQPPSAGAPSRRQSGVAGTADNCSVM
ncbi:hypothetical protein, variant [Aphanomyces invadans]|uniref:MINDY deubiquitinase domain-containing protein n=1 Tax=Aphanomyces invadans TaxID=157072 RepID=A0A024TGH3_9STRA|nr:hypothetical protein, variant [Aphanomyces invadans]ETV93109.1 hypothetical protein, variant [Aphanomyces invadans]|eukprot:XP_008878373.1 hypothetical protein, variant [Aphanomyces invadans]